MRPCWFRCAQDDSGYVCGGIRSCAPSTAVRLGGKLCRHVLSKRQRLTACPNVDWDVNDCTAACSFSKTSKMLYKPRTLRVCTRKLEGLTSLSAPPRCLSDVW